MEIALIADTHGMLPEIPEGAQIVIHAGDVGPDRDPIHWFREVLYPWARKVDRPIYATFGNHDFIGQQRAMPEGCPANLRFLVDESIDIHGVRYWFSPWSLRFMDWAFMANEKTLAEKYRHIPHNTEVIVSHGPPFGCGDRVPGEGHVGSTELAKRCLDLPQLRWVVCGHIHEGRGGHRLGQITVINASIVDARYQPVHSPVVINIEAKEKGEENG